MAWLEGRLIVRVSFDRRRNYGKARNRDRPIRVITLKRISNHLRPTGQLNRPLDTKSIHQIINNSLGGRNAKPIINMAPEDRPPIGRVHAAWLIHNRR
jgi:hypothetical protein